MVKCTGRAVVCTDKLTRINNNYEIGVSMELLDAINTNGTCRYYTEQPVDGDLIVRLLQAAQKGPSGSNRQPVQFLVVRDAQKRQGRKLWWNSVGLKVL